jgi:glyoxylase-like metal-dependent hydrolase (beta-lactamase superfamily II)
MDDGEMSKQTSERMKGVFAGLRRVFDALNRKVTPYEPDKEVAPGITSVATYGHTPGHNSFIVASGNSKVFVQADVTNIPLFVRNPGWHLFFDQDPVMAEATRRKTYDIAGGGKNAGAGLPLSLPRAGLHRKERHRIPRDARALEPDALTPASIGRSAACWPAARPPRHGRGAVLGSGLL